MTANLTVECSVHFAAGRGRRKHMRERRRVTGA
jgi:hypothetical protein